jgi:hypothetical protein
LESYAWANNKKGDSMETKQHITLEVQKGDYAFVFHMPVGSSWGNAIDASFEILQRLNELAAQSAQQLKPVEQEGV